MKLFENRKSPDLWVTLERIRRSIGLDELGFQELMKLSPARFARLRAGRISPPMTSIYALLAELHLSFENLIEGKVDYECLSRSFAKKLPPTLPQRYSEAAFSRRRTSVNVLSYVEATAGWHKKDELLRHFQIEERIFNLPDEWINIRFLTDACRVLKAWGYSDLAFSEMGRYSAVTNRNSQIETVLSSARSVKQMHEMVFADLLGKHYDQNLDYTLLELTDSGFKVQVTPSAQAEEFFRHEEISSPALCVLRGGVGTSFPVLAGLPPSRWKKTHCIHQGDPACIYEYDFTLARSHHVLRRGRRIFRSH